MENKDAFIQFSTVQLSKILKLPTQDAREMTNYILSIPEESGAVKYLNDILGPNSPFTVQFITNSRKLSLFKSSTNQGSQEKALSKNQLKKQKELEASQPRVVSLPQQAVAIEKADVGDDFYKVAGTKKKKTEAKSDNREYEEFFDPDAKKKAFAQPILIKKKKLRTKDGEEEVARERQQCGCQGTMHPFVNNCLHCGRIACEIEGEGLCYYCQKYFITYHEEIEGVDTTQVSGGQRTRDSVIGHKSMIYDDQSDYYNFNDTWLSAEEKNEMRKKELEKIKAEENKSKKFTIDFGGRKILADGNESFASDISSTLSNVSNQKEKPINYMSTEDYKKRHNEYTKKESQTLITQFTQKKKKRDALEDKASKRLQSEFFPDEEMNIDSDTNEKKEDNDNKENRDIIDESSLNLPPGLIYKKNFITRKEELELVKLIDNLPYVLIVT